MARDPLDRRFERFRERGDVSALAEIFDEVAPEMLRVARHVAPRSMRPWLFAGLGPGRFTLVVTATSVTGPLLETALDLDGVHDAEVTAHLP